MFIHEEISLIVSSRNSVQNTLITFFEASVAFTGNHEKYIISWYLNKNVSNYNTNYTKENKSLNLSNIKRFAFQNSIKIFSYFNDSLIIFLASMMKNEISLFQKYWKNTVKWFNFLQLFLKFKFLNIWFFLFIPKIHLSRTVIVNIITL